MRQIGRIVDEPAGGALERHYTVDEVAKLWGVHPETIRKLFRDCPGVLKIGGGFGRKKSTREYCTLRIPESVVRRVHQERSR
jgi:hypothetical protein